VPGLLAWLEHAVGWELDRREGRSYRFAEPMEAVPPEEVAVLATLAAAFGGTSPATQRSVEAIVELLDATRAVLQAGNASATSLH